MATKALTYVSATIAMLLLFAVTTPALGAETTYGGRAFAVSVNTPLASATLVDTGPLPSEGGVVDVTPVGVDAGLAQAGALLVITMGFDQIAQSDVAVDSVVLLPGDPNQIEAYFVSAMSRATCSDVYGFSDITSLVLAGQEIPITGEPNQVVEVPGVLTLTINERIVTSDSITVNALHLRTALGADVIVSSAYSSISCGTEIIPDLLQFAFGTGVPSFPGCVDWVTGGGWIKPPPNKGTFGFVAGYKPGGDNPRGNFVYHDHTYGLMIKATAVEYYNCGTATNSRVFGGHAEVNHVPGYCYQVYVEDNGEPGNRPKGNDYLALFVWAPGGTCPTDGTIPTGIPVYSAGNYLGGGNIQLHIKK